VQNGNNEPDLKAGDSPTEGNNGTRPAGFCHSRPIKRGASTTFGLGIVVAKLRLMIDVALSILALIAGGLALELFASACPPLKDVNERGIRLGLEPSYAGEEGQTGNPS
jgi:hypothetical protein